MTIGNHHYFLHFYYNRSIVVLLFLFVFLTTSTLPPLLPKNNTLLLVQSIYVTTISSEVVGEEQPQPQQPQDVNVCEGNEGEEYHALKNYDEDGDDGDDDDKVDHVIYSSNNIYDTGGDEEESIDDDDDVYYYEEVEEDEYEYEEDEEDDEYEYDDSDPWTIEEMKDSDIGLHRDWWYALDCDRLTSTPEIPSDETWSLLRSNYQTLVAGHSSSSTTAKKIASDPNWGGYGTTGFRVPIAVEFIKEKGRGIITKSDIPKGTILLDDTYAVPFETGRLFRKFIASLPPMISCDLLQWCFIYNDDNASGGGCVGDTNNGGNGRGDCEDATMVIMCDLDEQAMLNGGLERDANMKEMNGVTVASRDIQAGEELVINYLDFVVEDGWEHFEL